MLTAAMVLSLAACGGGSGSEGEGTASGDEGKDPYTVTMVLQGSQPADEERIEEKINEILEKEVNANLDIVVLPWASATQQLQLMLAGDEKIDCFYTNATNAIQYMHSGQIMDMSELVGKYGKNLKDIYGGCTEQQHRGWLYVRRAKPDREGKYPCCLHEKRPGGKVQHRYICDQSSKGHGTCI